MWGTLALATAVALTVQGAEQCTCGPFKYKRPEVSDVACPLVTKWGEEVTESTVPFADHHPNPQLQRRTNWLNLNGKWEFQPAEGQGPTPPTPPFGKKLNMSILVPYPPEACLSGVWVNALGDDMIPNDNNSWTFRMWYRRSFDLPFASGSNVLHFGAVDWQATVYLNGELLGKHVGGYDAFSFDVTSKLKKEGNELLVFTYDPSDWGPQVFGKQRVSATLSASGDTYTPSSGIWQTVWLENIASSTYVKNLKLTADTKAVSVEVTANDAGSHPFKIDVLDGATVVASGSGTSGKVVTINIPNPKLWSTDSPFLYNMTVTLGDDVVDSYFGMRTFRLGKDEKNVTRPLLNGKFVFAAGWLDQSFWPDGLYSAPSYDALAFDVQQVKAFGLNMVRLHQKVNPPRWYYEADRLGVLVFQDMVQHYGDVHKIVPSQSLYFDDLQAMVAGLFNHPSIVQWEVFNEGDMVGHFNASEVVQRARELDPTRLVDTDSGGPANDLHVGDVNDVHNYPYPKDPKPSATQYAMVGELGGLGAFDDSHSWRPGKCYAYKSYGDMTEFALGYLGLCDQILSQRGDVSASVYTQITDLERECDGLLNYDRTAKFDAREFQAVQWANQALINDNRAMLHKAYAHLS